MNIDPADQLFKYLLHHLELGNIKIMKLRYRGNFYDPSEPSIQTYHQPIKMIYRGHEFEYQPQPIPAHLHLVQRHYDRTVKLIYRGHIIDYALPVSTQPQPRVTNWRYAMLARQIA